MFGAILASLVVQNTAMFITQAFANRLMQLCQQAYYNLHMREACHQQIRAEVYNAFSSSPPHMHEQMASNLMSALASCPVHAAQMRQLGPRAFASRYPLLCPVIYSIADVLMPGWDAGPTPTPTTPQYTTPTNPVFNLPRANPLALPAASTPEARTPVQAPGNDVDRLARLLLDSHLNGGGGDGGEGGGRAGTPRGGRVWEIDQDADTEDEESEGREAEQRIRQLKNRNPAAYHAAKQKLRESRQSRSETGDAARAWIASFLRLPLWEERRAPEQLAPSQQRAKLRAARQKLEDAVAGHNEAKEILVNRVALWLRNPDGPGMVMGIHGPPGNGKTSLVDRGLAQALERPICKIDCGGIGDARILRGDRNLYVSAAPGKIAQALMKEGTTRLIILFDELDRVSKPEVHDVICNLTDPSRNSQFDDAYFGGVPLDLSKAIIVCTFNDDERLDAALKDRMGQIIHTNGLNYNQKVNITRRFLIPEALTQVRLTDEITFSDSAVRYLVNLCIRDLGARRLKSHIQRLVGAANCALIEDEESSTIVTEEYVRRIIEGL